MAPPKVLRIGALWNQPGCSQHVQTCDSSSHPGQGHKAKALQSLAVPSRTCMALVLLSRLALPAVPRLKLRPACCLCSGTSHIAAAFLHHLGRSLQVVARFIVRIDIYRELPPLRLHCRVTQSQRRTLETQVSLVRHGEIEGWKQYYRAGTCIPVLPRGRGRGERRWRWVGACVWLCRTFSAPAQHQPVVRMLLHTQQGASC